MGRHLGKTRRSVLAAPEKGGQSAESARSGGRGLLQPEADSDPPERGVGYRAGQISDPAGHDKRADQTER